MGDHGVLHRAGAAVASTMIPIVRIFEMVVATAFYSGLCYMVFEGAGARCRLSACP